MSLEEKIIAAVNTYIGAFEKKDLDAIMGIYADECTVEDPVGSPVRATRAAVREFYEGAVQMDIRLQLEGEIRVAGNEAAFAFTGEMKQEDGSTMRFSPIDTMKFNDEGQVVAMRAYFGPGNTSAS